MPCHRSNITKLLRHRFVTGQSQLFKEPKNLTSIPEELYILNERTSPKRSELRFVYTKVYQIFNKKKYERKERKKRANAKINKIYFTIIVY